jgi:hypothetical protein
MKYAVEMGAQSVVVLTGGGLHKCDLVSLRSLFKNASDTVQWRRNLGA